MLIASTYSDTPTLSLPNRPFYAQTYLEAARTLFHTLYLNIFTGTELNPEPFFSPTTLISLRTVAVVSKDPILQEAVRTSGGVLNTRILNILTVNSGLYEASGFEANLCDWVMLCYAQDFTRSYENLYPILFDEQGNLYENASTVWPLSDSTLTCGRDQASNYSKLSPYYRWLSIVTKNFIDQSPANIELIFRVVIPLMAGPLNPVALYKAQGGESFALPLGNFTTIFLNVSGIVSPKTHSTYDLIRQEAWSRFFSFNGARFHIAQAPSASEYFSSVSAQLGEGYNREDSFFRTVAATLSDLCNPNGRDRVYSINDSAAMVTQKYALEAFDLISDKAVNGDGTDSTVSTDPDNSEGDPATDPISATSKDDAETEAGNNPMSIVQQSPNGVNNNSIGETSSGSKTLDAVTPVGSAGSTPGQLNKDYAYLMSVITLNSRIRDEPDFKITPSHREALESWCRYWVWIYPVSDTKDLMKEWGLQSLLSPF